MKRFRFWSNASKVEDLKNSEQGYFPADKVKEEGKFFGIKSYLNNFYLTSGGVEHIVGDAKGVESNAWFVKNYLC